MWPPRWPEQRHLAPRSAHGQRGEEVKRADLARTEIGAIGTASIAAICHGLMKSCGSAPGGTPTAGKQGMPASLTRSRCRLEAALISDAVPTGTIMWSRRPPDRV